MPPSNHRRRHPRPARARPVASDQREPPLMRQNGSPCDGSIMHMSMGMDSKKLVREAYRATLRAAAFCSSVAGTMPKIFFWLGQISTQTLNNMMVPSQAPIPMMILESITGFWSRPKVKVSTKRPWVSDNSQAPSSQVASADQRNHSRARGATYLLMPAPPGPPLSAAAAARAGLFTALE